MTWSRTRLRWQVGSPLPSTTFASHLYSPSLSLPCKMRKTPYVISYVSIIMSGSALVSGRSDQVLIWELTLNDYLLIRARPCRLVVLLVTLTLSLTSLIRPQW